MSSARKPRKKARDPLAEKKRELDERIHRMQQSSFNTVMHAYQHGATLKEAHRSLRRLREVIETMEELKIPFMDLNDQHAKAAGHLLPFVQHAEEAWKKAATQKGAEGKIDFFDSVERLRMAFSSDVKMVTGGAKKSQAEYLMGMLTGNIRHAALETLRREPAFQKYARESVAAVQKNKERIIAPAEEWKPLTQSIAKLNGFYEHSGGAKLIVGKKRVEVVPSFLNPDTFYGDNPVFIKPLVETRSEIYLHTHPYSSSQLTRMGFPRARWNSDRETSDRLGIPFLVFSGRRFTLHVPGEKKDRVIPLW